MRIFGKCERKRAYGNIRRLRNSINDARTDLDALRCIICGSYDIRVIDKATEQATEIRAQLTMMYNDIKWMMTNYRLRYPKITPTNNTPNENNHD